VSGSAKIAEDRCGDFVLRTSSLVFHVKSATGYDRDCAHVCSRSYLCAFRRFLGIFRKIPVSGSAKIAEDRCGDFVLRTSSLVFHVKSATGCDHAGVPLSTYNLVFARIMIWPVSMGKILRNP